MFIGSYGRKSRALGDPENVDVVAHQLRKCDQMAAQDGLTIPEENRIAEIGSGESLDQRPRFAAWLKRWEQMPPVGGGLLYCPEVSRLSRAEFEEIGRIVRVLRNAGIKVRVPGHTYDLSLPHDEMFFGYQALQSRCEVQLFKQRMSVKREEQMAKGEVRLGAKAWGYLWLKEQRRLIAHPDQFPILVACCREVPSFSIYRLARRYKVPVATLWTALTNPTICGWPSIHWGATPDGTDYHRLPREKWTWCGQQNDTYPHACTRQEFDLIQEVLAMRKARGLKTAAVGGWCRDVVAFPEEPGPVRISSCRVGTWPELSGHPIYERRNATKKRVAYIEREKVHEAAIPEVRTILTDLDRAQVLLTAYLERQAVQQFEENDRLSGVTGRLAGARVLYQQAVDAEFDATEMLRSALTTRRQRLEEEIGDLEQELRLLSRVDVNREQLLRLGDALTRWPTNFDEEWEESTEEQRRQIARWTVQAVEVRCGRSARGRIKYREVERVSLQPWFSIQAHSIA